MWWLEVRFSAAQSLPKKRIGGVPSSRITGQSLLSLTRRRSLQPVQRRRERQPAPARLLNQFRQDSGRVWPVVVQEHDITALERLSFELSTKFLAGAAGKVLGVDIPEYDRLPVPP